MSSGQIRPQTRAECEDAMSLLSGLASSVSLCARRKSSVSQCAMIYRCRRRSPRQCRLHVDSDKCNGPKSLSRRRSFLSAMICDFLTGRGTSQGPSFLDSQAPMSPSSFASCRRTSPFSRSSSQSFKRSSGSSNRLYLLCVLCTYDVEVSLIWCLAFTCFIHPPSFYKLRVLRHSSSFLQHSASNYRIHNI